MLLMVSASAATSPFDFTVRFCWRSPSATAVTTLTMPRTCSVRLAAITFTVTAKSFQVPATPGSSAWPPSWPWVPPSRPFGLRAELAFGAALARVAGHFRGEALELVHHSIDGVIQLQDFALH